MKESRSAGRGDAGGGEKSRSDELIVAVDFSPRKKFEIDVCRVATIEITRR
ncbi:MAG: hypothetical protein HKN33_12000 [Pyrinomonadaceae bacterium]|nr:hypothetical protein [Pyrinomonadaceae bacterium]